MPDTKMVRLTDEEARKRYPCFYCQQCYKWIPAGFRHEHEVFEYMGGKYVRSETGNL